jgi:polysaccharide chain length determinant protein (PEP-CTERM system associated)
MLGHRELTMQDYAGILRRRLWLILTSAILFLGIGLGVSYILPPEYVSQTLILIEEQKVPEDYVKPVVGQDLGQRLASMKEQILSRSRIQPIIERFNLFSGENLNMDDRIAKTQKAIGIKPIRSDQSSRGMPGFFISFKGPDARTAQQVCGEITSLFVSENLSAREQSAEGTTDFLKQQLADAKRSLDEQDAKLAAFEQKNIGKLPGQMIQLGGVGLAMGSPSQSTLQALTTQLDASTQSLNRLQQTETFLQAMITQQSEAVAASDTGSGAPTVNERQERLRALVAQKQEMETHYKPDYPDVVAISRQIEELKAQIAHPASEPAPAAANANRPDPPQLQQLKAQLRATQMSMSSARQEQTRIQQEIRAYEAKIEASPMIEQEYKNITRDHETALQFYNSLLTKMNESSMATALEHRQQGEQFHVMDAPNLPDEPTFPNPLVFAGGGFAAGLSLGLIFAAFLEYRDTSLRNERDIWAFTKLPTLATISYVEGLVQAAPKTTQHGRWKLFSRTAAPMEGLGG